MAMKTQADMFAEDYVLVQFQKRGEFLWNIEIRLLKRAKPQVAFGSIEVEDIMSPFKPDGEALERDRSDSFEGDIELVNLYDEYWQVSESNAAHGWGPFLYDIAMELAAEHNAWLCSDDDKVTRDARNVWKQYFENRPDVVKQEMPSRAACDCDYLKYGYRKASGDTIKALREAKRIHEHTVQCEESGDGDTPEVDPPTAE